MRKLSLTTKTIITAVSVVASVGTVFSGLYVYSLFDHGFKNENSQKFDNSLTELNEHNSEIQGKFYHAGSKLVAVVQNSSQNGKATRNTVQFIGENGKAEGKVYSESEFFNEYLKRYNNQTPVLKVSVGPTEFVNEYLEAVGIGDFLDYVDWFVKNVAWGPDILTLDRFRIVKGVNKTGSTVTLGGHTTKLKETKEIAFWPDSFFGSLPFFSEEGGPGNASDSVLTKINAKALSVNNVVSLTKQFLPINATYNYPKATGNKEAEKEIGAFREIELVSLMSNPVLNYQFYEVTLNKNEDGIDTEIKTIMSLEGNSQSELLESAKKQIAENSTISIKEDIEIKKIRVIRTKFLEDSNLMFNERNLQANKQLLINYVISDANDASQLEHIQASLDPNATSSESNSSLAIQKLTLSATDQDPTWNSIFTTINKYIFSKVRTFKDLVNIDIYKIDFNKYFELAKLENWYPSSITGNYLNTVSYFNSKNNAEVMKKLARELYVYTNPKPIGTQIKTNLFTSESAAKKYFGSSFDAQNLSKYYLTDIDLVEKTLKITLTNTTDETQTTVIEIKADDNSVTAVNQLNNFKEAIGYKVAFSPNYLSIANEYRDAEGKKVYDFNLFNEMYPGLIDLIKSAYPYLIKENSGMHIERKLNDQGAYEFSVEQGKYKDFTINDRISFIMLLKAVDPNFAGVGINFLKYVGAHEYGHHSTLENIQNVGNDEYSVLIGGIDARSGPSDQMFFDKEVLKEYLYARSSKLDIINRNLAFDRNDRQNEGNYPLFATREVVNGVTELKPEDPKDVWGSIGSTTAADYYEAFTNKKRRALQSINGLKEAASIRDLKVYDLFLLNAFDTDSGTLNPSIQGVAQYFKLKPKTVEGKYQPELDYTFTPAGEQQLESILHDGMGNPIRFTIGQNGKKVPIIVDENNYITVADNKEHTIQTIAIHDKNGKPIYSLGKIDVLIPENILDESGNPIIDANTGKPKVNLVQKTIEGRLKVEDPILDELVATITNTINNMMEVNYNINGWEDPNQRGGNIRIPDLKFEFKWEAGGSPLFPQLKDAMASLIPYFGQLVGAIFKENPAARFEESHPDYLGNVSFAKYINWRQQNTPKFDDTVKTTDLVTRNANDALNLNVYKDIPTNDASLGAQISKIFSKYDLSKESNDKFNDKRNQTERFNLLRFINSGSNVVSQYYGNSKSQFGYYKTFQGEKLINNGGVENVLDKIFDTRKPFFVFTNSNNETITYKTTNDELLLNVFLRTIGDYSLLNSPEVQKLPAEQQAKIKKQIDDILALAKTAKHIELNTNSTLFVELIPILSTFNSKNVVPFKYKKQQEDGSSVELNSYKLKFDSVEELVSFMSLDPSKFTTVTNEFGRTINNYDITYVETKFNLDAFKALLLNSPTKDVLELIADPHNNLTSEQVIESIKNDSTKQTLANVAMKLFIGSSLYAFNKDAKIINFADKNDQYLPFLNTVDHLFKKGANFDSIDNQLVVSVDEFNKIRTESSILMNTETYFNKISTTFNEYYKNNNIDLDKRGELYLSDIAFLNGKYSRLNYDYLSIFGNRFFMLTQQGVSQRSLPINYFFYKNTFDNRLNSQLQSQFNSRVNTALGQVFSDYTYTLPEVLTRDYVQISYSPSTSDFRTLNSYFSGINEYGTGMEYFLDGSITQRFIDQAPNMAYVNKLLGSLSYSYNKQLINNLIEDYKKNDRNVKALTVDIDKIKASATKLESNNNYAKYVTAYKEQKTVKKQLTKDLDKLHNVGNLFDFTNKNTGWSDAFSATLFAGPLAVQVEDLIAQYTTGNTTSTQTFFRLFRIGEDLDTNPFGLLEDNLGVQMQYMNIVANSGDDVEGTILIRFKLILPGVNPKDADDSNSVIVDVKMYGWKNATGVASKSPLTKLFETSEFASAAKQEAEFQLHKNEYAEYVNAAINSHTKYTKINLNSIIAEFPTNIEKEDGKTLPQLYEQIKLKNKILDENMAGSIKKIKLDNSFGLFGAAEFVQASANPTYIGHVRRQNNGFFKDRWLRKELGWELYDESGSSVTDNNINIVDLDKKPVTDRARAFWIYLLKSKGVGDRNLTGIWRNKAKDAVALWGYDKLDIINKAKYLTFEDTITGEKHHLKINTENTNNLFYYKKQAIESSKHTLADEGYGSWISDYTVMADYTNAFLRPGHEYVMSLSDKDHKFIKNITTGKKKTVAENGKTYNQAPIKTVQKTRKNKETGKTDVVTILQVNDQFNL